MMDSEERVEALGDALLDVVNEFTETTQMTTGEVMGALFALFVAAAQSSPTYDPTRLASEIDERVRALQ